MLSIDITTEADHGIPIVSPRHDVDLNTAPDLDEVLQGLISPATPVVVVDLSETPFIDSSGLAVLVRARNQLKTTGGELRVVAPDQRLFEVTGLASVFVLVKTLDEAIAATEDEPDPHA